MEIVRAEKMGFCFGVQEAIKTAEEVAEEYKGKRYIYWECWFITKR